MIELEKQTHAVIGMGKTGQSMVRFLQRKGAHCEAFDEHLQDFSTVLQTVEEIPCHAGPIKDDALLGFDAVWASPGVPWQHPALKAARDAGVPVQGDLTLFIEHCDAPLIAITGTNGKTTTTQTMQTLLETLPGGCDVGGNIGTPMLDLLNDENPPERVVLELSSFQLERCHGVHPQWAILLNVQADHADMHGSPEEYCTAKLKLFEHQQAGDTAMLPVNETWDELSGELLTRGVCVYRFGHRQTDTIPDNMAAGIISHASTDTLFWHADGQVEQMDCASIPTRGLHQHLNLAVAAQVAADFGVGQQVIREALSSFRGLPHRLRFVGNVMQHAWFDDSKATNPAAAMAALVAFDKVIWICGGLLKGLDLMPMQDVVRQHVSYAVIIGKHPEAYIRLMQAAGVSYTVANVMQRAVRFSAEHHEKLPVLLSPAAASMDQFKDYAERGRVFQQAIAELAKDS